MFFPLDLQQIKVSDVPSTDPRTDPDVFTVVPVRRETHNHDIFTDYKLK